MPTPSDRRPPHLDPHILDFLKAQTARGGPALSTLSPAAARNVLLSIQRSVSVPKLPADSSDRTLRVWDSYVPAAERREFTVSPLQASLEQLRGLPPALIITNENDVVRDEGEAYADKLMAAGVPVQALCYLGAIHDLILLNPLMETAPARAAMALVNDTLRIVFAHKASEESGTR